ncbi:MAG: nucleotidyltransferase domain-containing protein [Candidatus Parabeggiatoa sp.]|nr:nucleotidyltransferase domain-containing protein [Candidatus Parabeggiatoa sp.]
MKTEHKLKAEEFVLSLIEAKIPGLRCLIIFGSVATQNEEQNSDIDLLILVDAIDTTKNHHMIHSIARQPRFSNFPRLAINIESVGNYLEHLLVGDPFAVSIAQEGICLFNENVFLGIQSIVENNKHLPDSKNLVEYLKNKITNKIQEIQQYHIPVLLEAIYVATFCYLLKRIIENEGINEWSDISIFSNHNILLEKAKEILPEYSIMIQKLLMTRKNFKDEQNNDLPLSILEIKDLVDFIKKLSL